MKTADKRNPTLIQVKSDGKVIGHMSTKEFRVYMANSSSFLADLIKEFNNRKARINEPERVEQVLNAS